MGLRPARANLLALEVHVLSTKGERYRKLDASTGEQSSQRLIRLGLRLDQPLEFGDFEPLCPRPIRRRWVYATQRVIGEDTQPHQVARKLRKRGVDLSARRRRSDWGQHVGLRPLPRASFAVRRDEGIEGGDGEAGAQEWLPCRYQLPQNVAIVVHGAYGHSHGVAFEERRHERLEVDIMEAATERLEIVRIPGIEQLAQCEPTVYDRVQQIPRTAPARAKILEHALDPNSGRAMRCAA